MTILHAALLLASFQFGPRDSDATPSTADELRSASRVIGAAFTDDEIELMLDDVRDNLASFERIRAIPLDNSIEPATYFLPSRAQRTGAPVLRSTRGGLDYGEPPARPDDLEQLAFADIRTLAAYIHHRVVSCEELADMFLGRLTRLDEKLHCVVSLTQERALEQARALDAELERGESRGILHGIPWVAKDLLAARGTRTTWGCAAFEDQVIDADATVVELLDEAGAILIAKVSLGALAWGDVWFGGQTKNPWNLNQGSSGSSAGPSSAVAAGCAPFGIGSETLGSIVSPSTRCGNTALRPTFGRVSRFGAMTLSWTMDKLGPICRAAQDTAFVLDAIHGADPRDPTAINAPFDALADASSIEGWRIGYLEAFEENEQYARVLEELRMLEADLVPIELPDYPSGDMAFVLSAEAASAFDEFSAGDRDDLMVRQERGAWPNVFRMSRLIPAVDYIRATRLRTLLCRDVEAALSDVAALVHPSFAGGVLTTTNLSGHPTFVAPSGFSNDGAPYSISFTSKLYGETGLLVIARAWQASTDYHLRFPELK